MIKFFLGYKPGPRLGTTAGALVPTCEALAPSCDPAAAVDRVVPGDREQPCLETRVAAERAEPPIRADECILGGIFRLRRGADRRQRRPVDRGLVPGHQLAERLLIALPG